jgi:hypothetical protein
VGALGFSGRPAQACLFRRTWQVDRSVCSCLYWGIPWFSLSLQTNSEIVSRLGPDRFLTSPFQFILHHSAYHSTLYSLDTERNVRRSKNTQQLGASERRLMLFASFAFRVACRSTFEIDYKCFCFLTATDALLLTGTHTFHRENTVFWGVTPCSSERTRLFRGNYRLHIQGPTVSQARNQQTQAISWAWGLFELHDSTTQETVLFIVTAMNLQIEHFIGFHTWLN